MNADLIAALHRAVGRRDVLTRPAATARYRAGYRFGVGEAAAVVRPRSLTALWRVLQACVAQDAIVILQAANTGLTGGSTPDARGYDRPVVVVSTLALDAIHPILDARQVVCLPGATLHRLEAMLAPLGREPHSVIGSSCIGASVVGGVCNNSGGALVKRGPAYTEMALYAHVGEDGVLRLVNHLGIDLGNDPETMLDRLERGNFGAIEADAGQRCSSHDYQIRVRDFDADTPCRFNADPRGLHEASGSAGRIAVFAVRLDTFAREGRATTFYIGTNDASELAGLRCALLSLPDLPIAAEYIHRTSFDIAQTYGKDMFVAIEWLGTHRLPMLFAAKAWVDRWAEKVGLGRAHVSDRLLQGLARLLPPHLPPRMREWRGRYAHHLLLKVGDAAIADTQALLARTFPSATGDMFRCTPGEADKAFLHRFAVAGAAVRYRAIHGNDVVALDVALRANDRDWVEHLPPAVDAMIEHALYYGHFLCHVFHQDYLLHLGQDPVAVEHAMWALLDARGARYPAEHNVGHLYPAAAELADFYRELDPGNRFNPGIGGTSRQADWA